MFCFHSGVHQNHIIGCRLDNSYFLKNLLFSITFSYFFDIFEFKKIQGPVDYCILNPPSFLLDNVIE